MSRTINHNYFKTCIGPFDDNGLCQRHQAAYRDLQRVSCIPARVFVTRRGVVHRHPRFPNWSIKSIFKGPPLELKKLWRRSARAKQRAELLRDLEDPIITPSKRLVNLWNWY